eukprot:TRINITY_DN20041_c0_g1_i1.p1 TRINITY_DN20041_c0_g1~~TRINITY_DN20041_c0_g1_i1.p1  ORF type:complete len:368 (+),score=26.33 TRINITY_DN20041_c0_g1_i1:33-1106(+)
MDSSFYRAFGSNLRSDASSCPLGCSGQGYCDSDGICLCNRVREGDGCEIEWKDAYFAWEPVFWTYVSVTILLMVINIVFAGYLLISEHRLHRRTGSPYFNIVTQVNLLIVVGSFTRILYFTIDPHNYYGFVSAIPDSILFNSGLILWTNSFYLLILFWIELLDMTKLLPMESIMRTKPLFFVGIALSSLALLPLGAWMEIDHSFRSLVVYYGVVVVLLVFLIAFSLYHGIRLLRVIRDTASMQGPKGRLRDFMKRLTRLLFVINGLLVLCIILSALYSFYGKKPWAFIALSAIFRFTEFGCILTEMMFLYEGKRKQIKALEHPGNEISLKTILGRSSTEQVPDEAGSKKSLSEGSGS